MKFKVRSEGRSDRFFNRLDIREEDECWPWRGHPNGKGYGRFCYNKTVIMAHRVSWEIHNGPIPEGMYVLHQCDNPICCNPSHLFLGTIADNNRDMWAKGRAHPPPRSVKGQSNGGKIGSRHPQSKLTEDCVVEMRKRWLNGETFAALSREFGVSDTAAQYAIEGRTWRHVK